MPPSMESSWEKLEDGSGRRGRYRFDEFEGSSTSSYHLHLVQAWKEPYHPAVRIVSGMSVPDKQMQFDDRPSKVPLSLRLHFPSISLDTLRAGISCNDMVLHVNLSTSSSLRYQSFESSTAECAMVTWIGIREWGSDPWQRGTGAGIGKRLCLIREGLITPCDIASVLYSAYFPISMLSNRPSTWPTTSLNASPRA